MIYNKYNSGRQSIFRDLNYHPTDFKSQNELPKEINQTHGKEYISDKEIYRAYKNTYPDEFPKGKQPSFIPENHIDEDVEDDSDSLDTIDYDSDSEDYYDSDSEDYYYESRVEPTYGKLERDLSKNRLDINPTNPQPLPNNIFYSNVIRALVVGGSGSGKTTFLLHLLRNHLRYGLDFNLVIIYAPTESLASGLLADFILENSYRDDYRVLAFDVNQSKSEDFLTFDQVCLFKNVNPNIKPLVIYDDCVMALKRNKQVENDFNNYLNQGTRCNLVAMFNLVQDYRSIPPALRNSFTVMILFPKRIARSQFEALVKNCVNNILQQDKELYHFILDQINQSTDTHLSLLICGQATPDRQIRLNDCFVTVNYDNRSDSQSKNKAGRYRRKH